MKTQCEPVIDLDNPAILNELEWIGTGKIYPTTLEEVPEALQNYHSLQLEIPKDLAWKLLPDANLTVKELINWLTHYPMHQAPPKIIQCFH